MTASSKFRKANRSIDLEAAMRAGHAARTEAIHHILKTTRRRLPLSTRYLGGRISELLVLLQSILRVTHPDGPDVVRHQR